MPFESPELSVRAVSDRIWMLLGPLRYLGAVETFTVPAGFLTDFASVPRAVTWLIPTTGRYTLAAVLHDWCCAIGIPTGVISSRDTDALFRRVMREAGVPRARRWLIWAGVRWGAAGNPVRRPGWWRDAPAVLAISLLAAPLVIPAGLLVLLVLGVDAVVERLAG
jgi:hypothetical protein